MRTSFRKAQAFTLIELLATIMIIISLASMIFPVFSETKNSAKRVSCISNLSQIGKATAIYNIDYDDYYPYAINTFEKVVPNMPLGLQGRDPAQFPFVTSLLSPYVGKSHVWHCPKDSGKVFGKLLDARPTFHSFNDGSSYFLIDNLDGQTATSWSDPSRQGYATDASRQWHSLDPDTLDEYLQRFNLLFYDGHVSNVSAAQNLNPTFIP
jgi:prepilin-type processing-associated H-X9-DG protein